jgi:hypothetical protein
MVAATLVAALFSGIPAAAQQGVTLAGTGKKEAKKPFPDYTARARDVQKGLVAGTSALDPEGAFSLSGLQPERYIVELLDPKGKVVCTEGPFDMTKTSVKNDVVIDCNKVPTSWWVLAAAAGAGITSGVAAGDSTGGQPAPTASTFSVDGGPASAAR